LFVNFNVLGGQGEEFNIRNSGLASHSLLKDITDDWKMMRIKTSKMAEV